MAPTEVELIYARLKDKIDAQVVILAKARDRMRRCKNDVDIAEANLLRTDEAQILQEMKDRLTRAKIQEAEAYIELRRLGPKSSAAHPHPAITNKAYTIYDIDEVAAVKWAAGAQMWDMLKIDTAPLKNAKLAASLDFITVSTERRSTIARDLSKYLPEEPDDEITAMAREVIAQSWREDNDDSNQYDGSESVPSPGE